MIFSHSCYKLRSRMQPADISVGRKAVYEKGKTYRQVLPGTVRNSVREAALVID